MLKPLRLAGSSLVKIVSSCLFAPMAPVFSNLITNLQVPPQFPSIIYGMNVAQAMNDALRSLGVDPTQIRLVQGGFASSHSSGLASLSTASCPFAVVEADPTSGYSIHEITSPGFDSITPNDINDSGQVVGTGQSRTQPNIPWMMQYPRPTPWITLASLCP